MYVLSQIEKKSIRVIAICPKIFFFFEIFEKSADFATKFGWGISATKGSPLWKKNEIDQKRYPNISVFFGFHFVFFGFSGTRGNFPLRKKKKRNGPNYTELDRTVRVPPKLFGGKLIWALKTGFFLVANLVKLLDTGICIFGIRPASGGVNLPKWTSSRF